MPVPTFRLPAPGFQPPIGAFYCGAVFNMLMDDDDSRGLDDFQISDEIVATTECIYDLR